MLLKIFRQVFCVVLVLFGFVAPVATEELTPQWFSLEFKGGVWIPTGATTKNFLSCCQPTGVVNFGFLYHSKWGAELGVGFTHSSGLALSTAGVVSGDRFSLLQIPIENNFTFRADFKENQIVVPYVRAGPDYVYFRENTQGNVTSGLKFGLHGAVGVQILLEWIDDLSLWLERDVGVNDVYLVIEGRYGWIDNFGARGLNLSGLTTSAGLLFEF